MTGTDEKVGAVIGAGISYGILLCWIMVEMVSDVRPDTGLVLLMALVALVVGALAGYAYVAVWSRWRAK